MPLRHVVLILLAMLGLTVVEGILDINDKTLGRLYWPYMVASTLIVIALVVRMTRPRTPPAP